MPTPDIATAGPPRIELARLPTPLQPLDNLSAEIGGPRIWIKRDDLTEGPAGGNKLRKLEFSVGQALADGADLLITAGANQSNHCRQTAFAAARLGLRCHLVLRGRPPSGAPDGNLLLDDLFGAEISHVDQATFDDLPAHIEELMAEHRGRGSRPFWIPVGASDGIGMWGYIEAAAELAADFDRADLDPSHLVAAVGSGGTQAGLVVGAARHGLAADIVGFSVSRPSSSLRSQIDHLITQWSQRYHQPSPGDGGRTIILDRAIEPGYGKAFPQVYETIRRVARFEGIVLDPVYTGKAFDAMLTEIDGGRLADATDIVFLHTGGIYSVFPHRDGFSRSPR